MKIAVVGDIIVSSGLLAEAAKSLNIDDEPEIKEIIWNSAGTFLSRSEKIN